MGGMGETRRTRIDGFSGSKENYIGYLESQLRAARDEIVLLRSNSTPSATDTSLGLSREPIVIQFETPTSQVNPPIPPWQTALSGFIQLIPKTEEEWKQRREAMRLVNTADLVYSIRILSRLSSTNVPSFRSNEIPEGDTAIIAGYRKLTTALYQHHNWARQLFQFSTLLYVCSCVVAIANGDDKDAIDNDMVLFLQSTQGRCKAGKEYLRRVRQGGQWVVTRARELCSMGLEHRAWELFLLCGPHVHAYQKCTHYKDSMNVTKLVPICRPQSGEVQASIPFAIPIIIWIIGRGRWDLGVINQALHTEVHHDDLGAWLKAFSNAQLSISGPRLATTEALPKRRRIDKSPVMRKQYQNALENEPDDELSLHRLENQRVPSDGSGYWRALLDAACLELQGPMIPPVNSGGQLLDEVMSTSRTNPLEPPSTHSQDCIDQGPRRDAAGDCEWDGLVDWVQPGFPSISAALKQLIMDTSQLNINKFTSDMKLGARSEAWRLDPWPPLFDGLLDRAIKEIGPEIKRLVAEDLRFNSMQVILRSGALKAEKRAIISFIVPTMIAKSTHIPRVQFHKGEDGPVSIHKNWPVVSILEKDICIRVLDQEITFIWVRFFTKKHWDWLASRETNWSYIF
ncbi:hypothetical protein HD806DRAFT_532274 [Xylariaceae sp. AK1471]|nr:hypothetical protein HD806DRAFT_532274 [Xylariaceae sp. AK1471]